MAVTKFHEKNQVLFNKIEAVAGTAETSFVGTDALAALTLDGGTTVETGSYTYIGDSLSRDEFTYQKDSYADFSAETPQQVVGTLNGALTVANAPLSQELQASGAFITVFASAQGSFPAGTIFADNTQVSNSTLTVQHRKTSAEDAVNNKLFVYFGCRGMVDVSANVGEVPKLKFTFKGNSQVPTTSAILAPDFGNQTTAVCSTINLATIVKAEIASFTSPTTATSSVTSITKVSNIATVTWAGAHSLGANGSIIVLRVSGATDSLYNGDFMATIISTTTAIYHMKATPAANASGTFTITKGAAAKTFCFSTLQAPNFFGFDYARYVVGCEEGYSKTAIPTDVSVGILEDQAGTTSFNPDANLQGFFCAQVKFGTAAGSYITYKWDKLQLTNVKNGKVSQFLGRDTTFRNTGKSYMIFE
jgi:hypothetical protein